MQIRGLMSVGVIDVISLIYVHFYSSLYTLLSRAHAFVNFNVGNLLPDYTHVNEDVCVNVCKFMYIQ